LKTSEAELEKANMKARLIAEFEEKKKKLLAEEANLAVKARELHLEY